VNAYFALAIGTDAKRRGDSGKPLAFVGPLAWFFMTMFFTFPVVLTLYWVIHYSNWRHPQEFPGR
jgi:hypothetical protein